MLHLSDYDSIISSVGKPINYVMTGFKALDKLIGGLRPRELIFVAARPAMGKTSFALNMADNISPNLPVMFLSLEMSGVDLKTRMLVSKSLVPLYRMRSETLTQQERDRIIVAGEILSKRKLYIQDNPKLGPELFSKYLQSFGAKLPQAGDEDTPRFVVFIDYLQMMRADKYSPSKTYELQDVIEALYAEIKKHNCTCIILTQLNRESEKRDNRWPRLSDLKDSGAIEQVADKVILLHRPDYYNQMEGDYQTEDTGEAYVIVAKNRSGRTGFVKMAYLPEVTLFCDITEDDKVDLYNPNDIPF